MKPAQRISEAAIRSSYQRLLIRGGLTLVFLHVAQVHAQDPYYISPAGAASNDGLSIGAPWDMEALGNSATAIPSGSTILFQRGQVHIGGFTLTDKSNITIGTYGSGNLPILIGSQHIPTTAWDDLGYGLYMATLTQSSTPVPVKGVYVGGIDAAARMTLAREPNANAADPWLNNSTDGSAISIVCSDLDNFAYNWAGGNVVVRARNWSYFKQPILTHTGDEIIFPSLDDGPFVTYSLGDDDWGFFLSGKLEALNAEEEWYHDGDEELYFQTPGGADPSSLNVRWVKYDHSIKLQNCTTVTITDLQFAEYGGYAVEPYSCTDITVENCTMRHCQGGISCYPPFGQNRSGLVVRNCSFEDLYDSGIATSQSDVEITDNTFRNIGLIPGEGLNGRGYMALRSQRGEALIENNLFDRIGYVAMDLKGNTVTVRHNYVRDALLTLNDGGGIFFANHNGVTLEENIVRDVQGEFASTSSTAEYQTLRKPVGGGLYFDNEPVTQAVLKGNVATGCVSGIHVDHTDTSDDFLIQNNTLFGNAAQLSITDVSGSTNTTSPRNNRFEGNILYSTSGEQRCMEQKTTFFIGAPDWANLIDFGTFGDPADASKRNYYFNSFSRFAVWRRGENLSTGVWTPLTLSRWQAISGEDALALESPLDVEERLVDWLSSTERVGNGKFDSGVSNWPAGSCISWDNNDQFGTGGSLYKHGTCMLSCTALYSYVAGSEHLIEFDIKSNGGLGVSLYLRASFFAEKQWVSVEPFSRRVRLYYTAPPNPPPPDPPLPPMPVELFLEDIEQTFAIQPAQTPFYLDNVSVKECTTIPIDHSANHILRYNNPLQNITDDQDPRYDALDVESFELVGCWADVQGNIHTGTVTLDPWKSIVLYRLDTEYETMPTGDVLHITANTTWNTDRNIKGSIVVDPGYTLTIDGATIGFADSRQVDVVTNVVVQPGGTLKVINGGHLTSVEACGNKSMWDGVKVLGQPALAQIASDQGVVLMESGGTISNALTAILAGEGDPATPGFTGPEGGAIVIVEDAIFRNNVHDHVAYIGGTAVSTQPRPSFVRTTFATDGELNYADLDPVDHVRIFNTKRSLFEECTFENSSTHAAAEPERWGGGIKAMGRGGLKVVDTQFIGLDLGVMAFRSPRGLSITGSTFTGCARGIRLQGVKSAPRIVNNTFEVPDLDVTNLNITAAYGTHLFNCTGFEFEGNTFTATGNGYAKVGAVFQTCGPFENDYYLNGFDGFDGSGPDGYSVGTIIMGNNRSASTGMGLTIKCNNYSNNAENNYDVSLMGYNVTIADDQGSPDNAQSPAGNTFSTTTDCFTYPGHHLYVEHDFSSGLNNFEYWHHEPSSLPGANLVPECVSDPIEPSGPFSWIRNSQEWWDDLQTCLPDLSSDMQLADMQVRILAAEAELETLREVYDDWRDGGDTRGLIDFIQDPDNDSYAVRNQLMLVAPSVSDSAWLATFQKSDPGMNPWHLAQALIANSPLTNTVLNLMVQFELDEFYQEMVYAADSGGVSMHSIYRSEMAYLSGVRARALNDLTALALLDTGTALLDTAIHWHENHSIAGSDLALLELFLAKDDLESARDIVDAGLQLDSLPEFWTVQDLYLTLLESEMDLQDLEGEDVSTLTTIAESEAFGAAQAQAWLECLGMGNFPEHILLPNGELKSNRPPRRTRQGTRLPASLSAYPNPSRGPVYLVMDAPEGAERILLRVMDPLGRLVYENSTNQRVVIVEIEGRTLTSGLYIAGLYADGIQIGTCKFQVVR